MADLLKTLAPEARQLADPDFFANLRRGHTALDGYVEDFDEPVELASLEAALALFRNRDLSAADDGPMAVAVRQALPLSRNSAARPGPWWWLCLAHYPDVVQRRWTGADGIKAERMFGMGSRLTRNALARLWWGAEMTRQTADPERYAKLMFRNQDVYEAMVGRLIGNYPLAVSAILDVVDGQNGKLARGAVKRLRNLLSTLVLECMSPEQLRDETTRCLERERAVAGSGS